MKQYLHVIKINLQDKHIYLTTKNQINFQQMYMIEEYLMKVLIYT
jgi:hypothetical protein